MKVNGEEIIAVDSDEGLFCPACWLRRVKDNLNDNVNECYITTEHSMDLIYELCNECACSFGGKLLFDQLK